MRRSTHLIRPVVTGCFLILLVAAPSARALIERIYSLDAVLGESTNVLVGKLGKVDAKARTVVMTVDTALKGEPEYKIVNMNIGLGPAHHSKYLMERLLSDQPVIIFYKRDKREIASLVHCGDTWFQLFAGDNPEQRDKVWWRFTHIELAMGRTFNGSTPDLIDLTGKVIAKTVKGPEPNPAVPRLDLNARRPPPPQPEGKVAGFGRQVAFPRDGGEEVSGISFVDINGDGAVDIYACRGGRDVLLVNTGDGFAEKGGDFGVQAGSRAAAWADYNGDDHPDLLTHDFQLFTQAGGKLRSDSALLPAPEARNAEGAGWIDYNGDGLPDVLITNGEHGIRLFANSGKDSQWFSDVSEKSGLGPKGLGAGDGGHIVFLDYDGDGYTDFLYNHGEGVLGQNDGEGKFRLDTKSGIKLPGGSADRRVVAVADYDNDGDLDLFVPAAAQACLFRNKNDGTFENVIGEAGDLAGHVEPSSAAAWGDVNCDGVLDLFVCHTAGPGRLYLGDGKGGFRDVSEQAGVQSLSPAHAAAFADLDDDGDLDLVVNLTKGITVAYNDMARSKDHRPVTISPKARKGTIGAVVRVQDREGRLLGMRELNGAAGCGGQAWPTAHFALPLQPCRISVALTDGRVAQREITPDAANSKTGLTFQDGDFK